MREIRDYKGESLDSVLKGLSKKNKDLIADFLKYCQITAGASSIVKIRNKIIVIADTIHKDLDSLTLENVRDFLVSLNKCNRAIATKNDTKKTLKRFLRWKYPDWSSKFNQLSDVKLNTKNEQRNISKSDLLTPDEMRILVSSVDSLKYKTILLIMQETANRPEEILKLRWKDINFNSNEIKLYSSKTGETRTIPINESVKHLIRYRTECFFETPRAEDFVFPSPNNKEKHLTTQGLNDFLNNLEHRLKFKKHLYPYLWRHSILSRMIKTLSPKVYEMFSGHSLEMGMKTYAHLDNNDLREELFKKVYQLEELTPQDTEKIKELEKKFDNLKLFSNLQTDLIPVLIKQARKQTLTEEDLDILESVGNELNKIDESDRRIKIIRENDKKTHHRKLYATR
jgi:integrase